MSDYLSIVRTLFAVLLDPKADKFGLGALYDRLISEMKFRFRGGGERPKKRTPIPAEEKRYVCLLSSALHHLISFTFVSPPFLPSPFIFIAVLSSSNSSVFSVATYLDVRYKEKAFEKTTTVVAVESVIRSQSEAISGTDGAAASLTLNEDDDDDDECPSPIKKTKVLDLDFNSMMAETLEIDVSPARKYSSDVDKVRDKLKSFIEPLYVQRTYSTVFDLRNWNCTRPNPGKEIQISFR